MAAIGGFAAGRIERMRCNLKLQRIYYPDTLSVQAARGRHMLGNRENKNEIIAHEWTTLSSLWESCKANVSDTNTREQIDKLFPQQPRFSSEPEDWHAFNLAEQRVGAQLDAKLLKVEYDALLAIAREDKIKSLDLYEKNATFFSPSPPEGIDLSQQRATYLSLLQLLQSGFVERRFRRRIRRETASRLFYFGLGVILVALLPLAVYIRESLWMQAGQALPTNGAAVVHRLFSSEPGFGLMMAATFGILGAYFSRVMSFQSKLSMLSFDDVMNLYQNRMLLVRLLYGMIGAVVFYFVLRSGLVAGSAFPDLSRISIGEQFVWKAGADGFLPSKENGRLEPSGLMILAPTPDLAKLLVWSFIAGFSERLIPDTLERTEAQGTKTG